MTKLLRNHIFAAILMACCLYVCPARAAGPVTHARVVGMLSAFESLPPREAWRDLGNEAVPILVAIAHDTSEATFRRARALTVLGHYRDPLAVKTLSMFSEGTAEPGSMRRAALLALAKCDMQRALPVLERALLTADPLTRQVAVKALAESGSRDAREILEEHRVREHEAFLTEVLEQALSQE